MKSIDHSIIYRRLTVTDLLPIQDTAAVVVLRGRIWLTVDGLSEDYFLAAGQRFELTPAMRVMISGEPSASVRIEPLAVMPIEKTSGDLRFVTPTFVTLIFATLFPGRFLPKLKPLGQWPHWFGLPRRTLRLAGTKLGSTSERLSEQVGALGRYFSYGRRA
jgi:hypothetical protein